jgi:hypothetical protein
MSLVPRHEKDRSGWIGNVHIYAPACVRTPKWASHERLGNLTADQIVVADCCLCKMRADETVVELVVGPQRPLGQSPEERRETLWDFYFEPYMTIECAPGFGCTMKPRRRSSRHLREHWYSA